MRGSTTMNILLPLLLLGPTMGLELTEKFSWTKLDFKLENEDLRPMMPLNIYPRGMEIWKQKLFISVPRNKSEIPYTLNYIDLTTQEKSPLLLPYPNRESNDLQTGTLKSVHRMHIDVCDRLWLIDDSSSKQISPSPKLVVIDLNTDKIIKEHNLGQHIKCKSSFRNIIVDVNETDCETAYAYIADPVAPALVVYSLKEDDSWRVHHAFFSYDPLATDYNTGNLNYQKYRGILGMTLSRPRGNHKMLIFQPQSSNHIFLVRTDILKEANRANNNFHKFKVFGYKGKNSQSLALTFDKQNGILFYSLANQNAIGCWNSDKFGYDLSEGTVGVVAKSDTSLVNVSDLKIDSSNNLWILSNKYPQIIQKGLNESEVNFRIFSIPISDLISNTVCEKVTE